MHTARVCFVVATMVLCSAVQAPAQDHLGLVSVTAEPGAVVQVPVTVRDVSGTPLDEGNGFNAEIQGFGFRIDVAPAETVVGLVDFVQAGVTEGKNPIFAYIQPELDHVVVLLNFNEATDPLDFVLDPPSPGDVIGLVTLELDPTAVPGNTLELTIDPVTATLVNHDATISETTALGTLVVDGGSIVVDATIFADGFESGDTSGWAVTTP